LKECVEVRSQVGAGPVLRANDFAVEAAVAANDVGFGIHGGAVVLGELSYSGVTMGGEGDAIVLQELFVRGWVFVHAHADDSAAQGRDAALERVERRSLIHARRAPSGPEIHEHDSAAQVRQVRGLAAKRELEILGSAPAQAGLALTIIRAGKKEEKARQKREHQASFQFPYQSFVQANYNTCFLACRRREPGRRSCGVSPKTLVSVIIPARNEEASIARAIESIAAQAEVDEVIVVNDQSTDRTSAILAELAARIPKLKLMTTGGLPEGWVGKNYALSIGAAAAEGDWLLFTDADTYHYPGATRRALADAVDHDAALVSYSPEQEMETFWERALIPYVYCRLGARFSFARVNDPEQPDAAANGQFLMILRDVYRSVGGHASVAGEVLEDVALARRVKEARFKIYFTAPIGIVRTRMYRSFRAMWEGWTKNLYPLMGGRPAVMLKEVIGWMAVAGLILLWGSVFLRYRASAWMFPGMFLALLVGAHLRYAVELYRNLYPVSYIRYYMPGFSLYSAALISSWWKNTRGTVVWKGRTYAVRTP